jgi:transcriptional repressor of dcmA and dcmR
MNEPLLNTREAARFLRVSEASIRRWTDAGLLATRRVGRRRERRFTEEDLRGFMNQDRQDTPAAPRQEVSGAISVRGVNLAVPCHLSTYFDFDDGRLRFAVPFLAAGLRGSAPCFLMAAGELLAAYTAALEAEGIDVEAATHSGRLVIRDAPGRTTDEAIAFWESSWGRSLEGGPAVIRVVGDMTSELKVFGSTQDMMLYEEAYDRLSRRYPVATICQYDVRGVDGVTMLRSLKAHPDIYGLSQGNYLI